MSFWGNYFIWKDIPSELHGLKIYSDMESGLSQGSAAIETITEKPFRRIKNYLLGVSYNPNLSFNLSIMSEEEITAQQSAYISKWLFGHNTYSKLFIQQDDMEDIFFNCLLNNPQELKVGNILYGYTCTVECDSPYAWTVPQSVEYTYTSAPNTTINFYNKSSHNGYLYPIVEFVTSTVGGPGYFNISIVNQTDSNREFKFTGVNANEKIVVDNDLQIIDSYVKNGTAWIPSNLLRLGNMANNDVLDKNKKWFRLLPGLNVLKITGNIVSLKFTYSFPKKIGG